MNDFQIFFEQLKKYLDLQRQSIAVTTAEGMGKVLSAIVVAIALIMVGSIMLLLLSLSVAYYLGDQLGSTALGFFILFAVVALIFAMIWAKRKQWISAPMDALTTDVMGVSNIDKDKVRAEAEKSQQELSDSFNAAIAPLPKAKNRMETFANMVSRGTMIFEGVMFGLKMMRGFRRAFRR